MFQGTVYSRHKLLTPESWAQDNEYSCETHLLPEFESRFAGGVFRGKSLNEYVAKQDETSRKNGITFVKAKDACVVEITFAQGAKRYEVMGRNGSLCMSEKTAFWLNYLKRHWPYGDICLLSGVVELDLSNSTDLALNVDPVSFVIGDTNIGHFMFDSLPMAIVLSVLSGAPSLIRRLPRYAADALRYAGIASMSLPDTNPGIVCYRVPELHLMSHLPPSFCSYAINLRFSRYTNATNDNGARKNFLLYKKVGHRRLTNFNEVANKLAQSGVETIDVVDLSFFEALTFFANAEHIIAPVGAETHNFLYSTGRNLVVVPPSFFEPQTVYANLPPEIYETRLRTIHELMSHQACVRAYGIKGTPSSESQLVSPDETYFSLNQVSLDQILDLVASRVDPPESDSLVV